MKKMLALLLTLAMVVSLAACGGGSTTEEPTKEAAETTKTTEVTEAIGAGAAESGAAGEYFKIGVAMKTQDGPYFVALANAVRQYCEEEGLVASANDVVVLNANMDVQKQSANMETFITDDYDMIFVDCIDPDNIIADEERATAAGIPVINIDSGVNSENTNTFVTTVYSDNKANGHACGLSYANFMGDKEIYSIVLSGEKGNVAGNERRQGLICGVLEARLGITEEEAWKLTAEADAQLLNSGSYTNEEANFTIAGQGWGNWTVNDILNDANDLVVKTEGRLNTMFGENDQMLFGGMQAAESAGLTGIYYVAAADGAKEAYDYIKGDKTTSSGEYYCTGENSPIQVGKKAVEVAKAILVEGADPGGYDTVTLTEAICVTKENVDDRYDFGF